MQKRIVAVILTVALTLGMVACGSKEESKTDDSAKQETEEQNQGDDLTIQETVLSDQDGVKVTAVGLERQDDTLDIKVKIENSSEKKIGVKPIYSSVNKYLVEEPAGFSGKDWGAVMEAAGSDDRVEAGSKTEQDISIHGLQDAGIETIGQIETALYVYDEDYELMYETEPVQIKTAAFDEVKDNETPKGVELYNKDGIIVTGCNVQADDRGNYEIEIYAENNGDKMVFIGLAPKIIGMYVT